VQNSLGASRRAGQQHVGRRRPAAADAMVNTYSAVAAAADPEFDQSDEMNTFMDPSYTNCHLVKQSSKTCFLTIEF
jgi:hypothetical protein